MYFYKQFVLIKYLFGNDTMTLQVGRHALLRPVNNCTCNKKDGCMSLFCEFRPATFTAENFLYTQFILVKAVSK